ncbi:MAG: Gx transporter family protein [Treponema sp.]|nr:Gx transporter family protein [Treponema sp.]
MPWPGSPQGGDRRKTLALLGALCFFLSAVEYLVPKPLPFMRIGLANMPLLLALNVLGARDFFLLVVLKVLGQGLIGGTFLSFIFLFSIAGTFTSATAMFALGRMPGRRHLGFAGIGCAGAMVSNGVQLLLARHLVFGEAVRYLAPPFLAAGLVAGVTLGIVCEYFCRRSRWYALRARFAPNPGDCSRAGDPGEFSGDATPGEGRGESRAWEFPRDAIPEDLRGESPGAMPGGVSRGGDPRDESRSGDPPPGLPRNDRRQRRSRRWDVLFNADELFVAGLLMALVFLHDRSLPGILAQFLFFCLLVWVSGRRNNYLATAAFIAGIVFFNLLVPHGRVLFSLGPLQVTRGSLFAGLERAFALSGLMMLSRVCVRSDLRLPGAIGSLLAEALRTLEAMRGKMSGLRGIGRRRLIAAIDGIMLEAETGDPGGLPREKPRRSAKGILLLALMVALTAAAARLIACQPGHGVTRPVVVGVNLQGPPVGLQRRLYVADLLAHRSQPVPPQNHARLEKQGRGIGDVGAVELVGQAENLADEEIRKGNPVAVGHGVRVTLHVGE